jgi:hypothetical protein
MDLCSHAGLLTKVLQEVIGNEHKGKERKWWMVEPSGELPPGILNRADGIGEALYRDRDFECRSRCSSSKGFSIGARD